MTYVAAQLGTLLHYWAPHGRVSIPLAACEEEKKYGCRKRTKKGLQSRNEDHGDDFDLEGRKLRGVQGAERVKRRKATEKVVPEFI